MRQVDSYAINITSPAVVFKNYSRREKTETAVVAPAVNAAIDSVVAAAEKNGIRKNILNSSFRYSIFNILSVGVLR